MGLFHQSGYLFIRKDFFRNAGLNFIGEENDRLNTLMRLRANDGMNRWVLAEYCPGQQCNQLCVWILSSRVYALTGLPPTGADTRLIHPRLTGRAHPPSEVPDEFVVDYREACAILGDSPKASAALSRRCLQLILREKLEAQGKDLYKEIQWVVEHSSLPSSVVDLLDIPRKVGNKAAHPTLSDGGLIVEVEPWEAEWCLEIIEALYDHVFVLPAKNRERLERLEHRQSNHG